MNINIFLEERRQFFSGHSKIKVTFNSRKIVQKRISNELDTTWFRINYSKTIVFIYVFINVKENEQFWIEILLSSNKISFCDYTFIHEWIDAKSELD